MLTKLYIHTPNLPGWEYIFMEYVSKLLTSKLIYVVDEVHICVNGDPSNMMHILDPLVHMSNKFIPRQVNLDAAKWEWPTLSTLHQDILAEDTPAYIGYVHLKGLNRKSVYDQKVFDWRQYLAYWTIERWQDCFKTLGSVSPNIDAVGVNWMNNPWPHYSGNFWWAKSEYIKTLKPLKDPTTLVAPLKSEFCTTRILGEDELRLEGEAWIGSGNGTYAQLHSSPGGKDYMFHYNNTYPVYMYR